MVVESGTLTPETIARRVKIAEAMLGDPNKPIQHWAEGLNELAKGYFGGKMLGDAEKAEAAGERSRSEFIASLMGGGMPGGMPASEPAAPPAGMPRPAPDMPPRPPANIPVDEPAPPMRPPGSPPIQQATEGIISAIDPVEGDLAPRINAGRPAAPASFNDRFAAALPRDQVAAAMGGVPMPQPRPAGAPGGMPAPAPPQAAAEPAAARVAQAMAPAPQPGGDIRAKIQAGLNSPSPQVRRQAQAMAQALIAQSAKGPSFDKLNDDTLYDKNTGRTMPAGEGYRPLVTPEDRARFGIPQDDRRPYQVGPAGKLINPPSESRVSVDNRQEGAFTGAAGKHQADRFNEYVKGGMEAQGLVADVNTLREIGSRIKTGKTAQVQAALGPYAEALGIKVDGLDDMQAYQAIVSRMAPRMRVAGSGATSDFEMQTFLKGLPSLGNTPQGNELIAQTLDAIQQHRLAASDIGSRALAGEIPPREAEKLIRELPDPLTLWRKNKGKLGGGATTPGANGPAPPELEAEMRRRGLLK